MKVHIFISNGTFSPSTIYVNIFFPFQKRESGVTTLTNSDGDKSSGTKSLTAPSTPQAESINFPSVARISNSIAPENIHADSLLDVDRDRELHSNLSLQETPLVCIFTFIILCKWLFH